jgi:hypothetical protein
MPIIITLDCNDNIIACEGEIPEGLECAFGTSKRVACEDVHMCDGKAFDADNIAIPLSEITIRKPYANTCPNKNTYRKVGGYYNGNCFKREPQIKTNNGQSESLYLMQLGVNQAVGSKLCNVPFWNNMSDRTVPGNSVPGFTSLSGAGGFGGNSGSALSVGLDIKHGSYDRYLKKLKSKIIKKPNNSCVIHN